jgi:death-on-curing family protein
MKLISIAEIKFIAFRLAQELMSHNEPIPAFKTRFPNILESCVAAPFQSFEKKPLYRGLLGKAAVLFYLMIKNHPFQNGNKRIAITALLVLLHKNKKWLKVDTKELYNFAVWVAESPAKLKDSVIKGIQDFLQIYLVDLK